LIVPSSEGKAEVWSYRPRNFDQTKAVGTSAVFCLAHNAMTLEQKRKDIDDIDAEILTLLDRRAEVVRELGQIKLSSGLPLVDWNREAEVIKRAGSSTGAMKDESANRIYRAILREAREIERELTQVGLRV
jgi:monofunctional chorismate mutase